MRGEREFLAEVTIIGKLRHRNLVRLLGWCHKRGELLLVYDYMPNGSVDKLLYGNHMKPQDSRGRSTANRRLEETVSFKNSDVDVVVPITLLLQRRRREGKQTEKSDVLCFGVFLLEAASGSKPMVIREGEEKGFLVDSVWKMWGDAKILDTADPQLEGMFDEAEMTKVLCLGLLRSHPSPATRPSMRQVLCILTGDLSLPHVPLTKPRVSEDIRRSCSKWARKL